VRKRRKRTPPCLRGELQVASAGMTERVGNRNQLWKNNEGEEPGEKKKMQNEE